MCRRRSRTARSGEAVSATASAWALEVETGSPTRKLVLLALADRHNRDTGLCCPSVALIAKDTELSENGVRNALRDLQKAGLIAKQPRTRENGTSRSNAYVLSLPTLHPVGDTLHTVEGHPAPQNPLEPELEPEVEPEEVPIAATPRNRDPVWDALVSVMGFSPSPGSESGDFAKTVGFIRGQWAKHYPDADKFGYDEAAITESLRERRRGWESHYPAAPFTHRLFRLKWAELGVLAAKPRNGKPHTKYGQRDVSERELLDYAARVGAEIDAEERRQLAPG